MAAQTSLRLVDPEPPQDPYAPAVIDLGDGDQGGVTMVDGVAVIANSDGSVTIDENPDRGIAETDDSDFYRNLANDIDPDELNLIASELLTGIQLDDDSRKDWLAARATFIRLLGLKLEEPRGDTGSAPLEGMSSIRHPLMLEATIHFQANALGELLPASGPVKVRNDLPMRPDVPEPTPAAPAPNIAGPGAPLPAPMPGEAPGVPPAVLPPPIGHNGPPEGQAMDDLATALEKDFNHFLTVTDTRYVPDTDRMMFYIGFSGDGFKKVHHCILRRHPVSESVDAEDIIVSDSATDMRNCGRVTQRIKMKVSDLKRMQIAGAYRDVDVGQPNTAQQLTAPEQEKAEIDGRRPQPMQPKDGKYEIYECYCELDIKEFAPGLFKDKGVPLPYVVTMEKHSRQVLAVRRNWDEDDEQCLAKQFFVQFPFIRGLGFYGLGLGHILGNVTMALTAIWRIMIDNGMFSNFPGFLISKGATRQNTNNMRVAPGSGFPVDVPPGGDIRSSIMPLPYKETGAAFTALGVHIEEVGQRLGQTAELNIGEGKQDVPVGTTMALIEQATKIMDSVHKRLHAAQAQEFGLLKERFKEDPEAFWRHNKNPARKWTVDQFKQALEQRELVPVADPNNPTSLHRIAKATIIDTLVQKYPLDMDKRASLKRILRIADIDADGLMLSQTASPPPDPRMAAIMAKANAQEMTAQIGKAKVLLQAQTAQMNFQDKEKERAFKEKMQQFELYLEQMRVQAEAIIHAHDIHRDNISAQSDIAVKHASAAHDIMAGQASHHAELQQAAQTHQQNLAAQRERQQQELTAQQERHAQEMQQGSEKHAAELEQKKALTVAAAKAKPSGAK